MDDKTTMADKQSDPKNTRIVITREGYSRIEKEGQIPPLSDVLRTEMEDMLNNYVVWNRRDRNVLSAKAEKAHYTRLHRLVIGLLDALDHVRQKFAGNPDFDEPTANADVLLFWRARTPLPAFCANLDALDRQLAKEKAAPKGKGGRPGDFHLPQFFCDLEELYTKAEGRVTGVTKTCVNGEFIRVCPFVDFVNAILRFAPDGCGPGSREAVAVAWERQWQRRRGFQKAQSQPPADPVSDSCQEPTQHQHLQSLSQSRT